MILLLIDLFSMKKVNEKSWISYKNKYIYQNNRGHRHLGYTLQFITTKYSSSIIQHCSNYISFVSLYGFFNELEISWVLRFTSDFSLYNMIDCQQYVTTSRTKNGRLTERYHMTVTKLSIAARHQWSVWNTNV